MCCHREGSAVTFYMVQITVLSQCHLSVITVLSWFLTTRTRGPPRPAPGRCARDAKSWGATAAHVHMGSKLPLAAGRRALWRACGLRPAPHAVSRTALTGSGTHDTHI